ncbi:hypothetical protein GQ42DRAFT_5930 [Ramicandelaber brevisporus]|nr:hypothetical protein GQ42DRAFT_5930 [Ramicandelaber brevisporus]
MPQSQLASARGRSNSGSSDISMAFSSARPSRAYPRHRRSNSHRRRHRRNSSGSSSSPSSTPSRIEQHQQQVSSKLKQWFLRFGVAIQRTKSLLHIRYRSQSGKRSPNPSRRQHQHQQQQQQQSRDGISFALKMINGHDTVTADGAIVTESYPRFGQKDDDDIRFSVDGDGGLNDTNRSSESHYEVNDVKSVYSSQEHLASGGSVKATAVLGRESGFASHSDDCDSTSTAIKMNNQQKPSTAATTATAAGAAAGAEMAATAALATQSKQPRWSMSEKRVSVALAKSSKHYEDGRDLDQLLMLASQQLEPYAHCQSIYATRSATPSPGIFDPSTSAIVRGNNSGGADDDALRSSSNGSRMSLKSVILSAFLPRSRRGSHQSNGNQPHQRKFSLLPINQNNSKQAGSAGGGASVRLPYPQFGPGHWSLLDELLSGSPSILIRGLRATHSHFIEHNLPCPVEYDLDCAARRDVLKCGQLIGTSIHDATFIVDSSAVSTSPVVIAMDEFGIGMNGLVDSDTGSISSAHGDGLMMTRKYTGDRLKRYVVKYLFYMNNIPQSHSNQHQQQYQQRKVSSDSSRSFGRQSDRTTSSTCITRTHSFGAMTALSPSISQISNTTVTKQSTKDSLNNNHNHYNQHHQHQHQHQQNPSAKYDTVNQQYPHLDLSLYSATAISERFLRFSMLNHMLSNLVHPSLAKLCHLHLDSMGGMFVVIEDAEAALGTIRWGYHYRNGGAAGDKNTGSGSGAGGGEVCHGGLVAILDYIIQRVHAMPTATAAATATASVTTVPLAVATADSAVGYQQQQQHHQHANKLRQQQIWA